MCVCVCEEERERERERELCYGKIIAVGSPECVCKVMRVEREGVQMLELDGQNSCDH